MKSLLMLFMFSLEALESQLVFVGVAAISTITITFTLKNMLGHIYTRIPHYNTPIHTPNNHPLHHIIRDEEQDTEKHIKTTHLFLGLFLHQ